MPVALNPNFAGVNLDPFSGTEHWGKYVVTRFFANRQKKCKLTLMRTANTLALLSLLTLGACGPETTVPNIHDTKYRIVVEGACAEDTTTGLMWELKSAAPGLHDWRNTYTWYNPEEAHDELDYRGLKDGGTCSGSGCDTWDFEKAVNAEKLCGFDDWRVPSRDELFSISDLTRADRPPTANTEIFAFMQAAEYWTRFDYSTQHESAWAWNFLYGHDRVDWKRTPKYVRLVRGTAEALESVKE